jgi:hypothetical protein
MYQCPKCKGWVAPHDDTYSHACVDTLQRIADKVAEHKDPDYLLAKAAFTVLFLFNPSVWDAAYVRAHTFLSDVIRRNKEKYWQAFHATKHLTPRRRWQEKDAAK